MTSGTRARKITWEQLELPLFAPPSFDDLLRAAGNTGALSVVLSRRLRSSWRVTLHRITRKRTLVAPALLDDAPAEVKQTLIDWALLPWRPRGRNRGAIVRNKKSLEQKVWAYLAEKGVAPRRVRPVDPALFLTAAKGSRYDLREVFDCLNERYFGGQLKSSIRWGAHAGATSCQGFRMDSPGNRFSLITIAGAYNHPDVPRFAIEAVVFHEMLHVHIPPSKRNGRNVIHGPVFKRAERALPHFKRWRAWERKCLAKIVRSMRRRKS